MPVVDQVEMHPFLTLKPVIEFNEQHDIVTQAWSPLGRGTVLDQKVLKEIADKYQKSPAQVVLRWHLQNGWRSSRSRCMKNELLKMPTSMTLNCLMKK